MQKKNLTNSSSLSTTDGLTKKKLKDREYLITIHDSFRSLDVEMAQYRSFIDEYNDKKVIYQLGLLKPYVGQVVSLGELPIYPPQDETDYYLLNNPNDLGRVIRYSAIQKEAGFTEDLKDICKYEFDHCDLHRVFAYKNDDPKNLEFKIVFSDPFHHVAIGQDSKKDLYWTYDKCKSKEHCISNVFSIED